MKRFLATALLGTALVSGVAYAQTTQPSQAPAAAPSTTTAPAASADKMMLKSNWRASKLIGIKVYNEANERLGDINELIVDKSGKINAVVIGVGGFLGMGERDVAVKFGDLKWSNEPVRSSNASGGAGTTTTRPATTGAGNASANAPKTYPDHAVFNASKDQLKSMPQFDYNK